MISSRVFMVSSLTFKSLIHFEFILVYGVRRWSSFVFLHVSVQFSQHHLRNKLYLAHCIARFLCQILIDYEGVGLFLDSLFCSIDLYVLMLVPECFDYYGLIVQIDIRQCDSPNFVLLSQDCCCSAGPLVISYIFLKYLFQICEIYHWYFNRMCVDSIDCFGYYAYFNDVNSPIQEHGICFHLFVFSSISFFSVIIFRVQVFYLLG